MAKKSEFDLWVSKHPNNYQINFLFYSIKNNSLGNTQSESLSQNPEEIKRCILGIDVISEVLVARGLVNKPIFNTRKKLDLTCEGYPSVSDYCKFLINTIHDQVIEFDNSFTPDGISPVRKEGEKVVMTEATYNNIVLVLKYYFANVFFSSIPEDSHTKAKDMFSAIPKTIVSRYKRSILNSFIIVVFFLILTALVMPTILNFIIFYIAFFVFILYLISSEAAKRYNRTYRSPVYTFTAEVEVLGYRKFDRFKIAVNNSTVKKECVMIEIKTEICGFSYQYPVWDFNENHSEDFIIDIAGNKVLMTLTNFDNTLFINTINGK